jgi:hypothetical protein
MARGRPKRKNHVALPPPPVEGPLPDLPPEAYQTDGREHAKARLKNPSKPHQYYKHAGNTPWVEINYDTWTMNEWREKFRGQQPDGRHWDFFGDPIDIWEGYSEE